MILSDFRINKNQTQNKKNTRINFRAFKKKLREQ